jgi:2-haloacid dehalogenase
MVRSSLTFSKITPVKTLMSKALVFDAYGTLFDVHSVARRCESFWPGKGALLSQAWRAKQLEYTWLRSLMRCYRPFSQVTREALAYACQALDLSLNEIQMEALMGEYLMLAPYPDAEVFLGKLKTQKRAILSNGSPDMLEPLVAHSGLRFDAVLSVDELRLYKPAPEVYELAVRKLHTRKEDIGFVSSNCWDALGAKSFGFTVYWINRTGAPVDRLGFSPDAILKSLGELTEAI